MLGTTSRRPPHYLALMNGKAELAELMMRKGADVNARDSFQWTPAMTAKKNNHPDLASVTRGQGTGGSR
jgi:ankyrin repeat protein